MASLIPGYHYDIFISYRQKDNRGDRWVSEFVDALKTELESTFKEEINVYFDIITVKPFYLNPEVRINLTGSPGSLLKTDGTLMKV